MKSMLEILDCEARSKFGIERQIGLFKEKHPIKLSYIPELEFIRDGVKIQLLQRAFCLAIVIPSKDYWPGEFSDLIPDYREEDDRCLIMWRRNTLEDIVELLDSISYRIDVKIEEKVVDETLRGIKLKAVWKSILE